MEALHGHALPARKLEVFTVIHYIENLEGAKAGRNRRREDC